MKSWQDRLLLKTQACSLNWDSMPVLMTWGNMLLRFLLTYGTFRRFRIGVTKKNWWKPSRLLVINQKRRREHLGQETQSNSYLRVLPVMGDHRLRGDWRPLAQRDSQWPVPILTGKRDILNSSYWLITVSQVTVTNDDTLDCGKISWLYCNLYSTDAAVAVHWSFIF